MARSRSSGSGKGDAKTPSPSSTLPLWSASFAFRLLNAFAVQTYFNADEFWQGPEVAHRFVFGYGFLTWEWTRGLRGYTHVTIFAAVYKLAAVLNVDTPFVIAWAPRVVQAAIAALGDVFTHKLAFRWFQSRTAARYALFCSLTCWFNFFCAVRTFSNCVESVLTAGALVYWPWGQGGGGGGNAKSDAKDELIEESKRKSSFGTCNRFLAVAFAGAACLIRPTAGMYWLPLFCTELWRTKKSNRGTPLRFVLRECLPVFLVTIGFGICVDFCFSGKLYVAAWNFFAFNIHEGGSAAYGTHPWHWYLTQGYPAVATVFAPLAICGCFSGRCAKNSKGDKNKLQLKGALWWEPFAVACYTIIGHSLAAHKEFRFLMPALPPTLAAAGGALAVWDSDTEKKWLTRRMIILILLTQIPAAVYLSVWHQSGTVILMRHLAQFAGKGEIVGGGIFFATPCHQTPFHSHMHLRTREPVPMTFLECPPASIDGRNKNEPDEADVFFANPEAFLSNRFPRDTEHCSTDNCSTDSAPSHVVMFDGTLNDPGFKNWLTHWGFDLTLNLFHAHFRVDRELQARVLVFKRRRNDIIDSEQVISAGEEEENETPHHGTQHSSEL